MVCFTNEMFLLHCMGLFCSPLVLIHMALLLGFAKEFCSESAGENTQVIL